MSLPDSSHSARMAFSISPAASVSVSDWSEANRVSMRSAFEVRDLYPKAESPSEGSIPSVAADTSRGLRPKVNALG